MPHHRESALEAGAWAKAGSCTSKGSIKSDVTALYHLQPCGRPAKLFIRQILNCHGLETGI